ncbi:MAG TPA: hypothetical protein VGL77_13690 [Armatimonadota bacterium]
MIRSIIDRSGRSERRILAYWKSDTNELRVQIDAQPETVAWQTDNGLVGFDIGVDARGALIVTYIEQADDATITVIRSEDGGTTWQTAQPV